MNNIYDYSIEQLTDHLTANGVAKFRAAQIWDWLYVKAVSEFSMMSNIDKKTLAILSEQFKIPSLNIRKHQIAKDGTQKALIELADGKLIETVLMKYQHGYSVCVTTQIGCAVGCSFCASGLLGFTRNLSAGEIVMQVLFWQRELKKLNSRVATVVVMGIGEPFNNYDQCLQFIDIINDHKGLNIGARHITVSTSGIVPKIRQFANYPKQINLAISLHSADDSTRSKIMKINNAYPLTELMNAVDYYISKTNRRVTFEYIMLSGINDQAQDAQMLASLVAGKNCHINIIPYNSVDENDYRATMPQTVKRFANILSEKKIQVSVRRSNGEDIDGACGQLRHKEEEQNA